MEINPTKFVKGKGLDKLLDKSNCKALYLSLIVELIEEENLKSGQDAQNDTMKVNPKFQESEWYKYIFYYLMNLEFPKHLSKSQERSLKLHTVK